MKFNDYLKDKLIFIIINLLCMVSLSVFLLSVNNTKDTVLLILTAWLGIVVAVILFSYHIRKKYLEELVEMAEMLEEKYLISEIMAKPAKADDKIYYLLLKMSSKSMMEKIAEIKTEQREYKEYIEQWVHEVKTPITAMKLICENNKTEVSKSFLAELEKTNQYVDQTLYFARSEHTEKDYFVRETCLLDIIDNAIAENKYLLLQNKVQIDLRQCEVNVYTDEKWIAFILNQLIVNAVKYKSENPLIRFETEKSDDKIVLAIYDNGVGISQNELPRIFEKGFTGSNGRNEKHSTGIGLYLCKRLCDKLGVGIYADSDENGTSFKLIFYKNDFII